MMETNRLPAHLQRFFTERLLSQMQASPNTVASYRDTFRLLLGFAQDHLGRAPTELLIADLDADLVGDFLSFCEEARGNSARTRNARLAAIRSFFNYVAVNEPQLLLLPAGSGDPDETPRQARRGLPRTQRDGGPRGEPGRHLVRPPRPDAAAGDAPDGLARLRSHRSARVRRSSRDGRPCQMYGQGPQGARHAAPFGQPRGLAPLELLHNGVDRTVIALWLGHERVETTQMYVHADITLKERAWREPVQWRTTVGGSMQPTNCSPSRKRCRLCRYTVPPVPERPTGRAGGSA